VTPNWSRVKVTAAAGTVTTLVACFPFVFTKLLNFVGIYGLLLAPAGAIVVTEHWLFPRLGLTRYWASQRKLLLNWLLHLFFLFLPVYVLTSLLYIVLASLAGARQRYPEPAESPARAASARGPATPAGQPNRVVEWITGLVAAGALVTCLVMAIGVAGAEGAGFTASLSTFKDRLILPTLIYFVSGTLFLREFHKGAKSPAA